jgi:hypothetical protein
MPRKSHEDIFDRAEDFKYIAIACLFLSGKLHSNKFRFISLKFIIAAFDKAEPQWKCQKYGNDYNLGADVAFRGKVIEYEKKILMSINFELHDFSSTPYDEKSSLEQICGTDYLEVTQVLQDKVKKLYVDPRVLHSGVVIKYPSRVIDCALLMFALKDKNYVQYKIAGKNLQGIDINQVLEVTTILKNMKKFISFPSTNDSVFEKSFSCNSFDEVNALANADDIATTMSTCYTHTTNESGHSVDEYNLEINVTMNEDSIVAESVPNRHTLEEMPNLQDLTTITNSDVIDVNTAVLKRDEIESKEDIYDQLLCVNPPLQHPSLDSFQECHTNDSHEGFITNNLKRCRDLEVGDEPTKRRVTDCDVDTSAVRPRDIHQMNPNISDNIYVDIDAKVSNFMNIDGLDIPISAGTVEGVYHDKTFRSSMACCQRLLE